MISSIPDETKKQGAGLYLKYEGESELEDYGE